MQPIEHAPSDVGAGYLDIDTNDPGNASQESVHNAEGGGAEGGAQSHAPPEAAAAGDEFRTRAPSVYLGFGAAAGAAGETDETRL
jgi:hypothetical protein